MRGIIIALPKLDDGKKIRRILEQNGFEVYSVCITGAAVFQSAEHFEEGIVISGYRLSDMYYTQLVESLPDTFRILCPLRLPVLLLYIWIRTYTSLLPRGSGFSGHFWCAAVSFLSMITAVFSFPEPDRQ